MGLWCRTPAAVCVVVFFSWLSHCSAIRAAVAVHVRSRASFRNPFFATTCRARGRTYVLSGSPHHPSPRFARQPLLEPAAYVCQARNAPILGGPLSVVLVLLLVGAHTAARAHKQCAVCLLPLSLIAPMARILCVLYASVKRSLFKFFFCILYANARYAL